MLICVICAQVMLVMHEERCKADAEKGRESKTWDAGTRLAEADVVGKEKALYAGLMYARQDAAAYEARCLLEPEQEKAREAERLRREAKKEAFHAEARKAEAAKGAALTAARIGLGDLVEAKFWQVAKGVWAAVDEKTEARHFWQWSVACEPWGGKLWVDKTRVWEAGVWALQPGKGVGGLKAGGGSVGAAGGGGEWATQSERQVMERLRGEGGAGVEIEMRNTGGVGAGALVENLKSGEAPESCAAGAAKKAKLDK